MGEEKKKFSLFEKVSAKGVKFTMSALSFITLTMCFIAQFVFIISIFTLNTEYEVATTNGQTEVCHYEISGIQISGFFILHMFAVLAFVLLFIGEVMSLIPKGTDNKITKILHEVHFLKSWFTKGFLMTYFGIFTASLNIPGQSDGAYYYSAVSGWLLFIVGFFYFILRLFVKGILERKDKRNKEKKNRALADQ